MNKFSKHIAGEDLYFEFLQALSGVLQLTKKEMLILAELIEMDVLYVPVKDEPKNILNEDNRFILQQKLKISRANLSTAIKRLRSKGCIVHNGEDTFVSKSLIPDVIKDRVQIILLLKLPWPESDKN